MDTYVMMTSLSPETMTRPERVEELNRFVQDRLERECPDVKWIANYAVLGPCDYLDIFEAPDSETAAKVSLLVRSLGHATTKTWLATPWKRFLEVAREMNR